MTGNIYFIKPKGDGYMKVGYTTDVSRRLAELQAANPRKLRIVAVVPGTQKLEAAFHAVLAPYRTTGEWFKITGKVKRLLMLLEAGARPDGVSSLQALMEFENSAALAAAWVNAGADKTARGIALPHILARLKKKGLTFDFRKR